MTTRSRRGPRINYSILNQTGRIVETDSSYQLQSHYQTIMEDADASTRQVFQQANATAIITNVLAGIEELKDLMDEHEIYNSTEADNNEIIQTLTTLRGTLRHQMLQLKAIDPNLHTVHENSYAEVIAQVKDFVKTYKDYKSKQQLRNVQVSNDKAQMQLKSQMFIADDTNIQLVRMESIYTSNLNDFSNEQLLLLKSQLPDHDKTFRSIAANYHELLKSSSSNEKLSSLISDIGERYMKLNRTRGDFLDSLNDLFASREIDKFKSFKEANLNINLKKFTGYESTTDVYTFRSNFEKLHSRNTPKKLLPDLLINNYLGDPALSLVKGLTDINVIWDRLIQAYGNSKILISRKFSEIKKLEPIKGKEDPTKVLRIITGLINTLRDLISLAKQHNIENQLYYGDTLDHVYALMGDTRLDKWLTTVCDEDINDEKEKWPKLICFLEKDVKLLQQKVLLKPVNYTDTSNDRKDAKSKPLKSRFGSHHSSSSSQDSQPNCYFCDDKCSFEHVQTRGPFGKMVTQYFSCKQFVDKTPRERLSILKRKGLCFQCLFPGAKSSEGKHRDGKCQHDFVCQHPIHQTWQVKKHVLVCEEHKDSEENQKLLETFKNRYITKNHLLPTFAKEIQVSFHADCHLSNSNTGIYLLQQVSINNKLFTVFFDNGCSDFVVRKDAIEKLGSHAVKIFDGCVDIGGVGGTSTQSNHGIYSVNIPLHDGQMIPMLGICLDQITQTFPMYPLTSASSDLHKAYAKTGGDASKLPSLPKSIGGDVDIMIGIKYLRFHPKLVFQTSSGLSIYESSLNGVSGRGIIGGPHKSFDEIHKKFYSSNFSQHEIPLMSYASLSIIGYKNEKFDICTDKGILHGITTSSHHNRNKDRFDIAERTGSEILYRCVDCRNCKACKSHGAIENISIKEEVEQNLINNSIQINKDASEITALLPFIHNPQIKLAPNKDKAMKVYQQQIRKLNKVENIKDKEDVMKSENKLQNLGFVDYVRNLPTRVQQKLQTQIRHFIPWRVVWKPGSVSTPCRIVFDGSSPTPTGFSLNDTLAKGRNNLNRLQEIAIRWMIHQAAFTTDISKMYNTVKLSEDHWCYQRYIWHKDLKPDEIPEEKVIKTLIYGVRSSGNQAEHALREVARLSSDLMPEASKIILNDIYVDDCVSGAESIKLAHQRAQELEHVVNKGGFQLKGIVISGEDPPETMSEDKESVIVAGMKWFPKSDVISLNISELNFGRKIRGKKSTSSINIIPEKLTRRHCVSKVGEVFDLLGRVTPITACFKIDLHELVLRNLDWDDVIPDHLREIWINNFEMMQEINQLKYRRTIVPSDAVNLELETLDFADASHLLVCVAIYARFKCRSGGYSSQLILSRSRIVPDGMSQPRAELYAALLNAHTGEVVRKSYQQWHQSAIKFSDSQIVLHWLSNDKKTLKQWVRSRVIESLRFTESDQWCYVKSEHMIADIGTRRGSTLADVDCNSRWFNGDPWMKLNISEMPIFNISEIKMTKSEEIQASREIYHSEVHSSQQGISRIMDDVFERLKFSNYLISPVKYRFQKVIRIIGFVIKFCQTLMQRIKNPSKNSTDVEQSESSISLTETEIQHSKNYFFMKSSQEIKKFVPSKKYRDITTEKNGILFYTGRILNTDDITIVGRYNNVMKDLSSTTFCVPVVDKSSPVAVALVNEVHWYHHTAKHSGVESTLRFVLKEAYIIEGRALVKMIRKSCQSSTCSWRTSSRARCTSAKPAGHGDRQEQRL
ncbi:MAG: hypothetical protein AAF587_43925 [Bacteroidota bacterium]